MTLRLTVTLMPTSRHTAKCLGIFRSFYTELWKKRVRTCVLGTKDFIIQSCRIFVNENMQLELTERILKYVDENGQVDTLDLAKVFDVEHQKIIGALKSIEANGELLQTEQTSRKTWELTEEGKFVLANGSHEAGVFNSVPKDGINQADLMKVNLSMAR